MPEGDSHGKNLIGTSQIELVVKLLILRVFDRLANDTHAVLFLIVYRHFLRPPWICELLETAKRNVFSSHDHDS